MRLDRWDTKIAGGLIALVFLGIISIPVFIYGKKYLNISKNIENIELPQIEDSVVEAPIETAPVPVAAEVKEEIKKAPPKHVEPKKTTTSTTTNTDGTKTTTLSEGGISAAETSKIADLTPVGASPYDIRFSDETLKNAALEKILKDYLNSSLKWGNEISSMYQLTIRDAGDTGWSGQYAGSYTRDQSGKIVSAFGYIVLNSYYYENDPLFNDYMKLVLSHEYGHHYSLYHKWVDMNLPIGVRFPDAYYTARNLSKITTAIDYSLGWANCEAEIVAEDYSYLYSGYSHHAMAATYGYPTASVRTWFESLSTAVPASTEAVVPEAIPVVPVADSPPTVSIIAPSASGELSGIVDFQAEATDDKGITKVDFYIDDTKIGSDTTAPYGLSLTTSQYGNGSHTLKAIAYDVSQSTNASIVVSFNNVFSDVELPIISISRPSANPYIWSDNKDLIINLSATDNIGVVKIRLYVDDILVGESGYASLRVTWPVSGVTAGTHVFKAEAYDAAGNIGTVFLTVNKS